MVASSVHLKDRCRAPAPTFITAPVRIALGGVPGIQGSFRLVSARTGQPVILLETVRLQSNRLLPKRYDYPIQSSSILRTFNLSNPLRWEPFYTQPAVSLQLISNTNRWYDRCNRK